MLLHIVAQAEFFNISGNGVPGGLDSLFIVAIAVCACRTRCAWQARISAMDTVSKLQIFQSCHDGLVCLEAHISRGASRGGAAIAAAHQAPGLQRKAIRDENG